MKLDTPPSQVLIETSIAELTLSDSLQYGLEWFIKNKLNEDDRPGPKFSFNTLGLPEEGIGGGLVGENLALIKNSYSIVGVSMDTKPYNDKITLTMLEGEGAAGKSLKGCKDQYDRLVEGRAFGTLTCHDKFYLVINDDVVRIR